MSSLSDRASAIKPQVNRRPHRDIAIDVLRLHGFDDIASRIKNCGPSQYCQSAYCHKCRDRLVSCQTEKVLGVYQRLYGDDEAKARKNVYFLTTLNELCELDQEQVKSALDRGKKALLSLRRSFNGLATYGRFELEAMDTDVIFRKRPCQKKAIVLKGLNGGSEETPARTMGLFHLHALAFLNEHDVKKVRQRLSIMFPGIYRVQMRPLHDDKSVEQSIRNLCSYMLKSRTKYNYHMDTSGYSIGREIDSVSLSSLIRIGMSSDTGIGSFNVYSRGNGKG